MEIIINWKTLIFCWKSCVVYLKVNDVTMMVDAQPDLSWLDFFGVFRGKRSRRSREVFQQKGRIENIGLRNCVDCDSTSIILNQSECFFSHKKEHGKNGRYSQMNKIFADLVQFLFSKQWKPAGDQKFH